MTEDLGYSTAQLKTKPAASAADYFSQKLTVSAFDVQVLSHSHSVYLIVVQQ